MGMNDSSWEALFEKYKISERIEKDGKFIISANQIKEFREPRLMTKFDHSINLPAVFSKNNLAVLPLSRGEYVISSFNAYKNFEQSSTEIQRISVPAYIQSLMPKFLVSEAIAINYAHACGVLADFLEDDEIVATVNGRMSSGIFDFDIETRVGKQSVKVNNSQIEIDAAYEGIDFLSLFEAKRDISEDFLIRQLYYPFRTWHTRVTKPVKTVFLVFSNGVFNLYQYQFEDPMNYNSLRLVKQKNYVISTRITLSDIEDIIRSTPVREEPQVAFPQANSMARIINLIELLAEKSMTRQDITGEYAFDERQTNYYTDAGRYLDLIEKSRGEDGNIFFRLSACGRNIMNCGYRERQLAIATQILKHKPFAEILKLHLKSGEMPDMGTIIKVMKQSEIYKVGSESTYERRASTITGWINWILGIIEE